MKRKKTQRLVLNTTATADKTLQRVTFNITPKVRNETLEGREYIVAPMIMLTEGVHEGSQGPLYYPEEELAKTPAAWNHKPIVVYHPGDDHETATDPSFLEERKIGIIMNTKWDKKGKKLKAEAWIEVERAEKVDNRVLEALNNGQMMELSTGVYTDNEMEKGVWNGEDYKAIARNYRADHLAILPDQIGACSIQDGAGLLRLNQASDEIAAGAIKNEMSHSNLWNQLSAEIHVAHGKDSWLKDVYSNYIVYIDENEAKLYRQFYAVKDEDVELINGIEEVVQVTEYRTKDGAFIGNVQKENLMKKKQKFVEAILKNSKFEEADRETLMGLDEAVLEKMVPEEAPKEPAEPAEPATEPAPVAPEVQVTNVTKNAAPASKAKVTLNEYIAAAPAELQDVLHSGVAAHNAAKAELVGLIIANKKNVFSQEELMAKNLDELKKLSAIAAIEQKPNPIYTGNGEPAVANSQEEVMVAPTMNFGAEE